MSGPDDFLQAILANPDDDTPRLVYADWLEERGDPRGEFIQLQCELARLPLRDQRVRPMREREEELLTEHHRAWLGPVHEWTVHWKCCRGFVEEIAVDARVFREQGEELFQLAPIRHVRFFNAVEEIRRLAGMPILGHAPSLDFRANGFYNHTLEPLGQSPHLGRVTHLGLAMNQRDSADLVTILYCRKLPKLVSLDLSDNDITDYGVTILTHSPLVLQLQHLDLRRNPLGQESRRLLIERVPHVLL